MHVNIKKIPFDLNGKIKATARFLIRPAAAVTLCYLAWRGESGLVDNSFLRDVVIIGLLSLIWLV